MRIARWRVAARRARCCSCRRRGATKRGAALENRGAGSGGDCHRIEARFRSKNALHFCACGGWLGCFIGLFRFCHSVRGNVRSFGQFKQELAEFLDEADNFAENAVLNPPVAAFTERVREEQG